MYFFNFPNLLVIFCWSVIHVNAFRRRDSFGIESPQWPRDIPITIKKPSPYAVSGLQRRRQATVRESVKVTREEHNVNPFNRPPPPPPPPRKKSPPPAPISPAPASGNGDAKVAPASQEAKKGPPPPIPLTHHGKFLTSESPKSPEVVSGNGANPGQQSPPNSKKVPPPPPPRQNKTPPAEVPKSPTPTPGDGNVKGQAAPQEAQPKQPDGDHKWTCDDLSAIDPLKDKGFFPQCKMAITHPKQYADAVKHHKVLEDAKKRIEVANDPILKAAQQANAQSDAQWSAINKPSADASRDRMAIHDWEWRHVTETKQIVDIASGITGIVKLKGRSIPYKSLDSRKIHYKILEQDIQRRQRLNDIIHMYHREIYHDDWTDDEEDDESANDSEED